MLTVNLMNASASNGFFGVSDSSLFVTQTADTSGSVLSSNRISMG